MHLAEKRIEKCRSDRESMMVWLAMSPLFALSLAVGARAGMYSTCSLGSGTIYDHSVLSLNETRNVSMKDYSGKVTLVVNVAAFGEFTPQYYQLNALSNRWRSLEFSIVAFPCDQFGHQEPGADRTELLASLRYVRPGNDFIPAFDLMMKIDVNGPKQDPLYAYMKSVCPVPTDITYNPKESFWTPIAEGDIGWNFEKILVDTTGQPRFRFQSAVEPNDINEIIGILMETPPDSNREQYRLNKASKSWTKLLKNGKMK